MRTLSAMLTTLLSTVAIAVQAQAITITLVNGHPPIFRWVKHLQESFVPAVDQALAGTGIRVNWKQHYSATLAKPGEELAATQDGVADVALVQTLFESAKLPLQNITFYTPFVSSDPGLVRQAVEDVQSKIPAMAQAWDDHNVVYLGGTVGLDDYHLFTKFPVNSLEDLKGRKIGTPGITVSWLRGTGAVGVAANAPEYYNALQTGLFDGVLTIATAAVPIKIQEVAPYITQIGYGAQSSSGLAANKDWYESQPQALKDALKTGAQAYAQAYLADLRQATRTAWDTLLASGGVLNPKSAELRVAYAAQLENPTKAWVAELEKRGLPAKQVLDAYMQTVRAAGARPLRQWDQE